MSEEENNSSALPPYPEMILASITALDSEGSSKSAISEYIESQYEDLPAGHSTLLAHHLNKMKDSGELVLKNGNYSKPDTTTPVKRGRGRPPKSKAAGTPGAATGTPRPRGRPPKTKDSLPVASAKASSGLSKRRGRPPKQGKTSTAAPAAAATTTTSPAVGQKRGRGRPPKVKPEVAAVN